MINKKIVLSMFIVAFVGVVAASGTWALYNDVITSTDNSFKLADWTDVTVSAGDASGSLTNQPLDTVSHSVSISSAANSATFQNILGGTGILKYIQIQNSGSDAKHIAITGSGTLPAGTTVTVGANTLATNGVWTTGGVIVPISAATNLEEDIAFSVTPTTAGQSAAFTIVFTVTP